MLMLNVESIGLVAREYISYCKKTSVVDKKKMEEVSRQSATAFVPYRWSMLDLEVLD